MASRGCGRIRGTDVSYSWGRRVTAAQRDEVKIVWCVHVIAPHPSSSMSPWPFGCWRDEKKKNASIFLLAFRCIRCSRWEHFAHAHMHICSCGVCICTRGTTLWPVSWEPEVSRCSLGYPIHTAVNHHGDAVTWRSSPISHQCVDLILKSRETFTDLFLFYLCNIVRYIRKRDCHLYFQPLIAPTHLPF